MAVLLLSHRFYLRINYRFNGQKQSINVDINCSDKRPQRTRAINRKNSAFNGAGIADQHLSRLANKVCP